MARIEGVDLPVEKRVETALTYVRGIGPSLSRKILEEIGVPFDIRVKDLSEEQVGKIREAIRKGGYRVEGELAAETAMNIKRLQEIGSYRGLRHARGLPVRGQRTKTNARTRRGRKMAVSGTSKSAIAAKKSEKT
jgi:small subunit ribosomal protein S13